MRTSRSSARSRWESPLTVACVPTGMNTGVSISPCPVCSTPARAPVTGHSAWMSNVTCGTLYCRAGSRPVLRGVAHTQHLHLIFDDLIYRNIRKGSEHELSRVASPADTPPIGNGH